ncbi:hypothetical protein [Tichowtungia aerotolerans]|uniref:Uncharacterized protein n=1 Tax=Tichowtungia aerotolerans TaxID=2697043 RepID=A0A6P1M8Z5_9BACT|nr:hypothetical protein [Tichowtungia aerotolerans]QHI69543.1 hypothetical protein GT409_08760 [Tichowtungia aerotolerans]
MENAIYWKISSWNHRNRSQTAAVSFWGNSGVKNKKADPEIYSNGSNGNHTEAVMSCKNPHMKKKMTVGKQKIQSEINAHTANGTRISVADFCEDCCMKKSREVEIKKLRPGILDPKREFPVQSCAGERRNPEWLGNILKREFPDLFEEREGGEG